MTKKSSAAARLRICNYTLLFLTVIILLSGLQLEILHGLSAAWIWIHVAVGAVFLAMCAWHIALHFRRTNWFARFRKLPSVVTRLLWWSAILTLLTGIVAVVHFLIDHGHNPIGGVHGKIGFLMIALATGHIIYRRKYFTRARR